MIWRVESPSAVRMQAREGEFHGLMSTICLSSRRLAGGTLENECSYMSRDDITADSANLKFF